jgi:hypothetical protein
VKRSHERKRIFWRRAIVALALIPVVLVCLLGGIISYAFGKAYITNNQILSEYEQEFHKTPHPTDTSVVALKRRVTQPPGNGGHCFYFVGEVRRFSGNRSSIKAFYADKQVQLEFFDHEKLDRRYLYGLDQLSNWNISETNSDENFYLVYTLETRNDDYTSIDLRCS